MSVPPSAASATNSSQRYPYWLKAIVLGVPTIYFLAVVVCAPWDRLGPPSWLEMKYIWFYDDHDQACMVQRGLSAWAGRSPGKMTEPEFLYEADFARGMSDTTLPEGPYFLEYPHVALYGLFCSPFLVSPPPSSVPGVILDIHYYNHVAYSPQNDEERHLYRWMRQTVTVYRVAMLLCLFGFACLLWKGYQADGGLSYSGWLLILPSCMFYTLFRFDIVPVLMCASCIAALGHRRPALAGFCLAVGGLLKVFPVLLVPLVLRYLWQQPDRRRNLVRWCTAFGATVVLLLLFPLWQDGLRGVAAPYRWQMTRAPYLWTAYGFVLPSALAESDSLARLFRSGVPLLVAGLFALMPIPDLTTLLRRCGVVVVVFVCLQTIFSPQWILWYLPFALPLVARYRGLSVVLIALDVSTYALWPGLPLEAWQSDSLQWIRLALQGALVVCLLLPPRRTVAVPAETNVEMPFDAMPALASPMTVS